MCTINGRMRLTKRAQIKMRICENHTTVNAVDDGLCLYCFHFFNTTTVFGHFLLSFGRCFCIHYLVKLCICTLIHWRTSINYLLHCVKLKIRLDAIIDTLELAKSES